MPRRLLILVPLVLGVAGAEPAGAPAVEPGPELYETGRQLFDTFAPPEIKVEFRFPTREEWDLFARRLDHALQHDSFAEIAAYRPQTEAALAALRTLPEYAFYANWLAERLDYIGLAETITAQPLPPAELPAPAPEPVPYYNLWLARLRDRAPPRPSPDLLADLSVIFDQNRVPPELVWLAEVESSFNLDARSPVGARGLFQIMPATAEELGLSLFPFDERSNPRKSARAAATYLDQLYTHFGSWPLALAAYNAGPGRVGRTLRAAEGTTYADIAEALPAETRMYVPKVLATVMLRTSRTLAQIEAGR